MLVLLIMNFAPPPNLLARVTTPSPPLGVAQQRWSHRFLIVADLYWLARFHVFTLRILGHVPRLTITRLNLAQGELPHMRNAS